MGGKDKLRILAAVDGSEQSLALARYLGGMLRPGRAEVFFLSVINQVPESYYDISGLPGVRAHARQMKAWEDQEKAALEQSLEECRQIFLQHGHQEGDVGCEIRARKQGVARDILAEAARGYHALALGRRGTNPVAGLVLGSVASKLVRAVQYIPVWLVGGEPETNRFVVGMDGSEGCLKAVNHLAGIIKGRADAQVSLIFVLRSFLRFPATMEVPPAAMHVDREWQEQIVAEMEPSFVKAERELSKAGLPADNLGREIVSDVASRAAELVAQAERREAGTIVMGRRGLSQIEQFFMGRVTDKVLTLARDRAVWIVN